MKICRKCGINPRPKVIYGKQQPRYCLPCKAEWMRNWRKTHPLTPQQKEKDRVRHAALMRVRRGKLIRNPCHCGAKGQMHHPDYSKPFEVVWLCHKHHQEVHQPTQL